MKNKRYWLVLAISLVLLLAALWLGWTANRKVDSIATVDVIRLFNSFKMKGELEARAEQKLSALQAQTDSIGALERYALAQKDTAVADEIGRQLNEARQASGMAYELSNKAINEAVWKRLNPLIREFGEQNGYRMLIGANGMGTILYNKDVVDVTDKAIQYANAHYESL